MHIPKIAISIGDLNGIGPEVIIKTFSEPHILNLCTPIIYASQKSIAFWRKHLKNEHFNFNTIANASKAIAKQINVVTVWDEQVNIEPGKELPVTGQYAIKSFTTACEDVANGLAEAIVTAPISKANVKSKEFPYTGHTEYLAQKYGNSETMMMMISPIMKLGLATVHIPLQDVAKNITVEKILKKIELLHHTLSQDFGCNFPNIAVLGLNPHAGEQGNIGIEERDIIFPAINKAKDKKIRVLGPFPADGLFGSGNYAKFDGILALYHDQGLIPFKALSFEDGVNYTAGISIVRTSPDHGTAFDIAGQGIANESSFRAALFEAIDISRNRAIYKEINANPLKKSELKGEGAVA